MNTVFLQLSNFVQIDIVHAIDVFHTRVAFWLVGMKS